MSAGIKSAIRDEALRLGFDAVGFAPARLGGEARDHLAEFLERGFHGDMGWLAARSEQRSDPQGLWPEAKSVVVLGMNYGPAENPLANLGARDRGGISVYARGRDYHDVVKSRLKQLARFIEARWPGALKVFVDTAPVMEKPLAATAGLGWQGKHTNLVSRGFGSWLFLGEIYLALELPPDAAETDHCGACRRCLDACPTSAFPAPYRLDARRCISYLTIEHKGHVDASLRPLIGNRIYGCDDCLAVCPWNKFARTTREPGFAPRDAASTPLLAELAGLDDAAFRQRFSGSPVKRIGRDRFLRNVLIAIGNSGAPDLLTEVRPLLDDPSPLVRAMAVWALRRLADPAEAASARAARLAGEADPAVREEWQRAG
ncbi:MAG TPA: tRNA epoxyqueuosine(34) reductase QueG [Stellaceae bacterium]|nr:tRNA epoxyqueuosine(34) reductase QueG [Stellaceae bacterium]